MRGMNSSHTPAFDRAPGLPLGQPNGQALRPHDACSPAALAGVAARWPAAPASEPATPALQLETAWARHADEVREAQQLRHRVFAGEMGARLSPLPGTPPGLDTDAFDAHCEHLLVRTVACDHAPARVVGTYRVLTPMAARRAGGLYSDGEFDLHRLDALRPRIAELGRSCTDPAFRHGGVILMLWAALAEFMLRNRLDITVGCASVTMHDGGHTAASLWRQLSRSHLVAPALQAEPRLPLPVDQLDSSRQVDAPALIKGYLKCGGKLLGPPAWDPDFCTADLPMMMCLADLPAAYRRRFIRA
jgi:putative hemolysin